MHGSLVDRCEPCRAQRHNDAAQKVDGAGLPPRLINGDEATASWLVASDPVFFATCVLLKIRYAEI